MSFSKLANLSQTSQSMSSTQQIQKKLALAESSFRSLERQLGIDIGHATDQFDVIATSIRQGQQLPNTTQVQYIQSVVSKFSKYLVQLGGPGFKKIWGKAYQQELERNMANSRPSVKIKGKNGVKNIILSHIVYKVSGIPILKAHQDPKVQTNNTPVSNVNQLVLLGSKAPEVKIKLKLISVGQGDSTAKLVKALGKAVSAQLEEGIDKGVLDNTLKEIFLAKIKKGNRLGDIKQKLLTALNRLPKSYSNAKSPITEAVVRVFNSLQFRPLEFQYFNTVKPSANSNQEVASHPVQLAPKVQKSKKPLNQAVQDLLRFVKRYHGLNSEFGTTKEAVSNLEERLQLILKTQIVPVYSSDFDDDLGRMQSAITTTLLNSELCSPGTESSEYFKQFGLAINRIQRALDVVVKTLAQNSPTSPEGENSNQRLHK